MPEMRSELYKGRIQHSNSPNGLNRETEVHTQRYDVRMFGPPIKSLTFRGRWQFVKTLVSIEVKGGIPRLVVHEKYERSIKWALRGLAVIGIAIGGLSFRAWYYGVAVAILILGVQQFFERTLFEYTAIHVSPMPFRYEPKQWIGVAFAFSADGKAPDIVGPAFQDRAYAEEISSVIKSWNYGQGEDRNDFIRLSFIIEGPDDYSIYIYPARNRPSVQEFFEKYIDAAVLKSNYKFADRDKLTKADYEYVHGKHFITPPSQRASNRAS